MGRVRLINRQKIEHSDENASLPGSIEALQQTEEFQWCGITIRVSYHPNRWKSYEAVFGYPLAQLQIKTIHPEGNPLPVTDTGYLCLHLPPRDIEREGGLVAYVKALLDYRAKFPEWVLKEKAARQLNLF